MAQLRSDQRSGEVQYEHARLLVGTSDNSETIDVCFGYRRSLDFDPKNSPGQDFAAVRGDANGYVVGVVADGVSQSFYGDLAAYHLSNCLLDALWDEREKPPSEDKLGRKLKKLEAKIAAKYVENFPIPDNLAPLHKESLEEIRSKGSQAVFAAFVLNASRKRLHLYQVGDVDAIVHYSDKSPESIQAPSKGRWSSAGKSEMRLQLTTYEGDEGASGIVIKSDGAGAEWGLRETVFNRSTFELLSEKRAGMDDLSFVAARWGNWLEGPDTEIERPLPPKHVSPPRRKKTEVLPNTKRYDPNAYSRKTLSGKEGYATEHGSREARVAREPGMTVRSGTRLRTRRPFAAVIVSCISIVSLLVVMVWLTTGAPWDKDPIAENNDYPMNMAKGVLVVNPPGVLGNDIDPEGKNLQVDERFRGPSNGRVKLDSNGSFKYTPDPGFNGNDSFEYKVLDPSGNQDTAKVTIKVRAPKTFWRNVMDIFGERQ